MHVGEEPQTFVSPHNLHDSFLLKNLRQFCFGIINRSIIVIFKYDVMGLYLPV